MPKVTINRFDGGMVNDQRKVPLWHKPFNFSSILKHFDFLSQAHKLSPYRGMVANQTQAYFITNFLYINGGTGVSTNILGFGVQSGQGISGKPELYMKSDSSNPHTSGWVTCLASPGAAAVTRGINNLFQLYKGYVYYLESNGKIGRWGDLEASGTGATLAENYFDTTLTVTSSTQGFIHPADDMQYFGVNNVLFKNNAGSISSALTLPTNLAITSIDRWQNYLAISCKPKNGIGKSTLFLWDRDTSLSTVSDSIDWGTGNLQHIANIGSEIVGVSVISSSVFDIKPRIIIRHWSGGIVQTVEELLSSASITLSSWKFVDTETNKLYFGIGHDTGTLPDGIWCVANTDLGVVVGLEYLPNNDTALTGGINGFAKFDDYAFVAFNSDGSVNRTNDQNSYSATSIWETTINPNMPDGDKFQSKKLNAIQVACAKLPANATVVCSYSADGAAYVALPTYNTSGGTGQIFTTDVSELPFADGTEYQFKIQSTGGAEILGLQYVYEIVPTQTP